MEKPLKRNWVFKKSGSNSVFGLWKPKYLMLFSDRLEIFNSVDSQRPKHIITRAVDIQSKQSKNNINFTIITKSRKFHFQTTRLEYYNW